MRRNLKVDINNIIDDSRIDDLKIKSILKDVFQELIEYQENLRQNTDKQIKEEYLSEKRDWDDVWQIKTMLEDKNNIDIGIGNGFRPIKIGNSIYFANDTMERMAKVNKEENQFFLNCMYDELESLCQKKYHGFIITKENQKKEFTYKLVEQYRFIEAEKLLYEIANLYRIRKPRIFSPYARRAVDICIENINSDEFLSALKYDFCLYENKLQGVLLTNFVLMWNVDIQNENEPLKGLEPSEKEPYYQYFYNEDIKENSFIYTKNICNHIYKKDNEIRIFCQDKMERNEYKKINILDTKENNNIVFENIFENKHVNKCNYLRTKADVIYILNLFNNINNDYNCSLISVGAANNNGKNLVRYRKEHSYFKEKNELYFSNIRNKPYICIKFTGKKIFLVDYANYVLHYLESKYPEYNWVGKY